MDVLSRTIAFILSAYMVASLFNSSTYIERRVFEALRNTERLGGVTGVVRLATLRHLHQQDMSYEKYQPRYFPVCYSP